MKANSLPPAPWTLTEVCANSIVISDAEGYAFLATYTEYDTTGKERAICKMVIALPALIAAAQDFCEKVESGRARSTDSYNKFKAALKELS